MNRLAVGLAVGAGYVLGRTKKAKFAFAVGTMVAGKRLNLSPKALGSLVTQQLENNPQFKEIGDQLRQDLRGVGKAATGSLLNRQLEGLADRLHDRTLDVQDRIAGVVPEDAKNLKGKVVGRYEHEDEDEDDEGQEEEQPQDREQDRKQDRQREKAPAKRSSGSRSSGSRSGQKTDPKSASAPSAATKKAPAKKTAQKTTARKTTQKKSTAARDTARRATSARSGGTSKGGRDNG